MPSTPTTVDASAPSVDAPKFLGWKIIAQYTDAGHGLAVAAGKIWSVDYTNDTVRVFDARTFAHVGDVSVGSGPSRIEVSGSYVFVVNVMASEAGDPYVTVLDARTNTLVHQLEVSEKHQGDDPMNYPWTNYPWDARAVGDRLFVTFPTNAEPNVMPIEIGTWKESSFFSAGSGPEAIAGAADRVAVVNGRNMFSGADDAVLVYASNGALLATLETGGRLHEAVNVGDKVVFAKAPDDHTKGSLVVVDPQKLSYEEIETCGGPVGLAVQGTTVYAACQWDHHVRAHDIASKKQTFDFDLGANVQNPRGIAVTETGDVVVEADGVVGVVVR